MHRKIKHFYIKGHVAETGVVRLRETIDNLAKTMLYDKGYVPVYGLGPYLSLTYDFEKERMDYLISVYGVFVGSEGVAQWDGLEPGTGKLHPRLTQQNTLSTSST